MLNKMYAKVSINLSQWELTQMLTLNVRLACIFIYYELKYILRVNKKHQAREME